MFECRAVEKRVGGVPPFPGANFFFHLNWKTKFLHENNMQDFSLFIEQGMSDKK